MTMITRKSVANLTKVSMSISHHLLSKSEFKHKNVVFSPLSLQIVLGIVTAASDGPTQLQLLSFLQSKSTDQLKSASSVFKNAARVGGPHLIFSNSIWVQKRLSLYKSFKNTVKTDFMASLRRLDFEECFNPLACVKTTNEVNSWAAKKTKGLVRDLFPPGSIDCLTRLIFGNVSCFQGEWLHQFDDTKTKDFDFHLNDSSVKISFMTSEKRQFIGIFDDFKVLRLLYKQGKDDRRFSMYIFLPEAKDGLLALIERITSDHEFFEHSLPDQKVKVGDFRIPNFKFSFGLDTSDMLRELGVFLPFSTGGLTRVAKHTPLWVHTIFQKTYIEVDEKGTKAATFTAAECLGSSRSTSKPVDFVADHPFLFCIREDFSGEILFVGQVLNPLDG